MAPPRPPQPSYTRVTHNATYPAINPCLPGLSSAGKIVVITGASGGIGRATAASFAASQPKALILLGRRADELAKTAEQARAAGAADLIVETHAVDLLDSARLRDVLSATVRSHGGAPVDVLVHCAGALAPVQRLVEEADPATFLKGYETTVVGTLAVAQAVVLANRAVLVGDEGQQPEVAFLNLTTAGILFPPFPGMGAYVSSKMAAVKLLHALAAENPHVRLVHVHPGFLRTAMSAELAKTTKLPFDYDESMCRPLPKLCGTMLTCEQSRSPPTFSSGRRPRRRTSCEARSSLPRGTWTSSRRAKRRLRARPSGRAAGSCGSDSRGSRATSGKHRCRVPWRGDLPQAGLGTGT
jgi:NAD(P)-dependent dehydrogenase (short-subunit alcohol dehydrogenase family)